MVGGDRIVGLALGTQGGSQVVVGPGQIRLEFDRPAEGGDRQVELPLVLERDPQVVMALGIAGLERDHPAVRGDRSIGPLGGPKGVAQIVVGAVASALSWRAR